MVGSASAQTLHMPPHEKYVLKNGLTVLLLEKHGVPMINVFALLKTGSAYYAPSAAAVEMTVGDAQ